MQLSLFTLGYEGLTIDAFIARLQAAQVKTVVDVRVLPILRKRGFQTCLSARPRSGLPQAHPQPIQVGWQLANLHP